MSGGRGTETQVNRESPVTRSRQSKGPYRVRLRLLRGRPCSSCWSCRARGVRVRERDPHEFKSEISSRTSYHPARLESCDRAYSGRVIRDDKKN